MPVLGGKDWPSRRFTNAAAFSSLTSVLATLKYLAARALFPLASSIMASSRTHM